MKESFKYYEMSAKENNADALNNLGIFYAYGMEVPVDSSKAFECFKKSAEQGWSEGQFNVGVCYAFGFGVDKNLEKAKEYFKKSSYRGVNAVFSNPIADLSESILKSSKMCALIRNWINEGL